MKEQVIDPIIHDVDVAFVSTIKDVYLKRSLYFILGYALWLILVFGFLPLGGYSLPLSAVPAAIAFIFLRRLRDSILSKFYEQFAQANGYSYAESDETFVGEGALFSVSERDNYTNIIHGNFRDHSIAIFNYAYTVGSGKHSRTYYQTVFEIDYDRRLPQMFLRVDKQKYYFLDVPKFERQTRLKLEGNFDDYFDLFVQEKFEIEALQIFTPDIMHKLMTDWSKFNLEFVNDKIYIYARGKLSKKNDLQSMYQLAQYLIEKLSPVLKRMESSVIALQSKILPSSEI